MQDNRTRYPGYDVLNEMHHWDEHTREIVLKRLAPFDKNIYLTDHEAEMISAIAKHIIYDHRKELLDYVVHHLDTTLQADQGEDQRKVGIPPQRNLARQGLASLDQWAKIRHGESFLEINEKQQLKLLQDLDNGQGEELPELPKTVKKELFKKLSTQIASAYYSHPVVWSEIGYGGPAYPRGYIRLEKGLIDPWEAKRDDRK